MLCPVMQDHPLICCSVVIIHLLEVNDSLNNSRIYFKIIQNKISVEPPKQYSTAYNFY